MPNKRIIKTAIWYDPLGSMFKTTEEQIDDDIAHYEDEYGPFEGKIKLHWYRVTHPSQITPGTALVLFDFGGCGMGNNLMGDSSRAMIQWAQDNPSVLIIVTSSFTYNNGIKIELEDLGLAKLPNVMEQFENEGVPPDWWLNGDVAPAPTAAKERCALCRDEPINDRLNTCAVCGKHICDECFKLKSKKKFPSLWPGVCIPCNRIK